MLSDEKISSLKIVTDRSRRIMELGALMTGGLGSRGREIFGRNNGKIRSLVTLWCSAVPDEMKEGTTG